MPVKYFCDKCGVEEINASGNRYVVGKKYLFHTSTYFYIGIVEKESDFHLSLSEASIIDTSKSSSHSLIEIIKNIEKQTLLPTADLSVSKITILCSFEHQIKDHKAELVQI